MRPRSPRADDHGQAGLPHLDASRRRSCPERLVPPVDDPLLPPPGAAGAWLMLMSAGPQNGCEPSTSTSRSVIPVKLEGWLTSPGTSVMWMPSASWNASSVLSGDHVESSTGPVAAMHLSVGGFGFARVHPADEGTGIDHPRPSNRSRDGAGGTPA